MKSSALLACVSLGILAPGAFAADYAVTGNVSEQLSGSGNYFLSNSPIGSTFKSETAANLGFRARTPDTRLLLDANASYYDYFGSGAAATSPKSGFPAGARFVVNHTSDLNRYKFAASWHRVEVATTQLTESGIVTSPGFLDSYRVGGGVTHLLSPTDSIGLSAQARTVSYTDATLTPYIDVTTGGTWTHLVNLTTSLITSASFDWYDANDAANSQRYFWQIVTALQTQLSRLLSFYGSIGAGFSNTRQNANVLSGPTGITSFHSRTDSSVQAYVGLTYRLVKNTAISLHAGQSLVPTTYGPLQTITTVGLSLGHRINDVSKLSFGTQFAHNNLNGFPADLFWARVHYQYQVTPALEADFSFTYRQRDDSRGFTNAGIALLTLNYSFALLGYSRAHDEREAEVEQARRLTAVQAFPGLLNDPSL